MKPKRVALLIHKTSWIDNFHDYQPSSMTGPASSGSRLQALPRLSQLCMGPELVLPGLFSPLLAVSGPPSLPANLQQISPASL